jgi:hypothetical protein
MRRRRTERNPHWPQFAGDGWLRLSGGWVSINWNQIEVDLPFPSMASAPLRLNFLLQLVLPTPALPHAPALAHTREEVAESRHGDGQRSEHQRGGRGAGAGVSAMPPAAAASRKVGWQRVRPVHGCLPAAKLGNSQAAR